MAVLLVESAGRPSTCGAIPVCKIYNSFSVFALWFHLNTASKPRIGELAITFYASDIGLILAFS
jgi:hypothetical protein